MTKLIHVSDPHIRNNPCTQNNINAMRIMKEIIQRENGSLIHGDCKVIVTGDITDTGDPKEFKEALKIFKSTENVDVTMIPGNHDFEGMGISGTWFKSALAKIGLGKYVGKWPWKKPPFVKMLSKEVVLLALDSNDPRFLANGLIGVKQMNWLGRNLKKHRDKIRVVAMHHHPWDRGFATCLRDSGAFMITVGYKADVLLFGHKHKQELWLNSPSYGVEAISAAGAMKYAPYSYVEIDINETTGKINVEERKVGK